MTAITEDYCDFEIAKLLKEKGFEEYTTMVYNQNGSFMPNGAIEDTYQTFYSSPTLQMVMKWLREIHNLCIIAPPQFDNNKWTYSAIIFKLFIPCTEIRLNDNKDKKEEAYEAAIKYCLENLI